MNPAMRNQKATTFYLIRRKMPKIDIQHGKLPVQKGREPCPLARKHVVRLLISGPCPQIVLHRRVAVDVTATTRVSFPSCVGLTGRLDVMGVASLRQIRDVLLLWRRVEQIEIA